MALHGSLQQMPLRELIDLAVYSALSGSLDIDGERSGRIYFSNGQIYHVECDGQIGIEALGMLLNVQQGKFNVTSGAYSEQQSVWGDAETLLRNAEHTALRWRRLWHQVPSMELVPALNVPREVALQKTNVALHLLLEVIDGSKRLSDIARELRWPAIDVVEGIAQLIAQQVVRLESVAREQGEYQPAVQPRQQSAVVPSLDRLLSILRS